MHIRPGQPYPLGATWDGAGVNFAVFSEHAAGVELCLFDPSGETETHRIALRARTYGVWHVYLEGVGVGQLYGLRVQGSAVSSDAKACDLQAGAEGMLTGLASALAGADIMLAFGLVDSAQTASLAKTVLDADTVNAIERFMREDPVDEARALMDDLVAVGIGGNFLARRSTRRMHREGELWQPRLWRRANFEQYAGTPLVKDAWERAQTLIAENDVPPLPEDVRRHVRASIDAYCRSRG